MKTNNKAIKIGPQKDVGRTAFHADSYGKRYSTIKLSRIIELV